MRVGLEWQLFWWVPDGCLLRSTEYSVRSTECPTELNMDEPLSNAPTPTVSKRLGLAFFCRLALDVTVTRNTRQRTSTLLLPTNHRHRFKSTRRTDCRRCCRPPLPVLPTTQYSAAQPGQQLPSKRTHGAQQLPDVSQSSNCVSRSRPFPIKKIPTHPPAK